MLLVVVRHIKLNGELMAVFKDTRLVSLLEGLLSKKELVI
jgi:hypothetical protein